MLIPLYIAIIGSDHEKVKHSVVTDGNQPIKQQCLKAYFSLKGGAGLTALQNVRLYLWSYSLI